MRPLYLDGCDGMAVLLDAPALRIKVPTQADRLFPLPRISRIVVSGPVQWETDALLACADQGISVVFLARDGAVRGRWLGRAGERHVVLQRLLDVLTRPDGGDRFADWRLAMQRLAVRSCARRMGYADWRAFNARRLAPILQRPRLPGWQAAYERINGLLLAQVADWLQQHGLDARSELLQAGEIDLPDEFSRLLFWDFEAALRQWQQRQSEPPSPRDVTAFYQSRSERVVVLAQGLLNKLHRWLVELA